MSPHSAAAQRGRGKTMSARAGRPDGPGATVEGTNTKLSTTIKTLKNHQNALKTSQNYQKLNKTTNKTL